MVVVGWQCRGEWETGVAGGALRPAGVGEKGGGHCGRRLRGRGEGGGGVGGRASVCIYNPVERRSFAAALSGGRLMPARAH